MQRLLAVLVLGLALVAIPRPAVAQETDSTATVTVQNNFSQPIDVFVEYGRFDRRLGSVAAYQMATLALPAWLVRNQERVQLYVEREAGVGIETQAFDVRPGMRFGMIVPTPPPAVRTVRIAIPAEEVSEATLTVENDRNTEVTVYAEEGGFQVRLGTVAAHSTRTLQFPRSVIRPENVVTLLLHAKQGFDAETQTLRLREGQHLAVRLAPR